MTEEDVMPHLKAQKRPKPELLVATPREMGLDKASDRLGIEHLIRE
jgi:hypothetical protein